MHLSALERLFINNSIKSNNSHAYEVAGCMGYARKIDGSSRTHPRNPPSFLVAGSKLKVSRRFLRAPLSRLMMGALP